MNISQFKIVISFIWDDIIDKLIKFNVINWILVLILFYILGCIGDTLLILDVFNSYVYITYILSSIFVCYRFFNWLKTN